MSCFCCRGYRGYVALWLCSYVAMWLCGYVAMWLCGYVAMGGTHGVPRKHFLFFRFYYPWIFHGFSKNYPWIFHGFFHGFSIRFSMDFPWIDFPWIFHELQNVSVVVAGTPLGVRKQSRHRQIENSSFYAFKEPTELSNRSDSPISP